MKKLITVTIAGSIILSGVVSIEAEAATINLFTKKNAELVKARKITTLDNIKLGNKLIAYQSKYKVIEGNGYDKVKGKDTVINNMTAGQAFFQDKVAVSKRKINVIIKNISEKRISLKKARGIYGKPLYTQKAFQAMDGNVMIDYYKNVSIFYYQPVGMDGAKKPYTVHQVRLISNKNKSTSKKWARLDKKNGGYLGIYTNAAKSQFK